jgi:hypothetical protein
MRPLISSGIDLRLGVIPVFHELPTPPSLVVDDVYGELWQIESIRKRIKRGGVTLTPTTVAGQWEVLR